MPKEVLKKVEDLGKVELEDRSTILRRAIMHGLKDLLAKKAAEDYVRGKVTLSQAAKMAELTFWEMEKYLVDNGFKSSYSVEDLAKEMRLLK